MVTIKWFDEPGLYLISFSINDLRNDLVSVKIDTYADESSAKTNETINSLHFVCYLRDLAICIWHQIRKLEKQLERKAFAKSRRYDFPLETVRAFEKAYDEKYS